MFARHGRGDGHNQAGRRGLHRAAAAGGQAECAQRADGRAADRHAWLGRRHGQQGGGPGRLAEGVLGGGRADPGPPPQPSGGRQLLPRGGRARGERVCTAGGRGGIWELLRERPQPSIAAISGWAIGGGLELALSADLRVADETARFGLPEVSLGILPSAGGMSRLVRLLSTARAKQLILLGERFDAARALELGVVTRVVPEGEPEAAPLEWAQKL